MCHFTRMTLTLLCVSLIATACTSNVGGRRGSVWDTYDYRHPVPGDLGLPSYGNDYYVDNESTYTPPSKGFGCTPDNLTMCE